MAAESPDDNVLALSEALDRLAVADPRAAELVKLRYFAGLTGKEAAGLLGISPREGRPGLGLRPRLAARMPERRPALTAAIVFSESVRISNPGVALRVRALRRLR